ncbi:putative DNA-binding protein with the Helix-hairpin-helix motif [Methanonatronarchaeum thermophilum]|uniref:Putative DNA-binding protein with the Helix-hairpin-helix motif n=2 Tax=Methanonatronarchaeum thermophilum TaxID=1927129 RepID=A0A1Y3GCX6_9EURY|nr:putative DNA-binding protein with the Helix-hairpin-helix motif [Methanonatronarchaeum thermophilum]
MSLVQKIRKLASSSRFDVVCGSNWDVPIFQSGQMNNFPLLKLLLSNECNFDCKYCNNRCRNKSTSINPKKVAKLTNQLYTNNRICGLFLSSGVYSDPEDVMEDLIYTAKLSREQGFDGYIHLKAMPGCSKDQIERASIIADRLSINIEGPTRSHLSELCSVKDLKIDIERRQRWIDEQDVGQSTQFVVGALDETDKEIINKSVELYEKFDLNRVYFSGFKPLKDTPLESSSGVERHRVGRLYQSDWLLRVYKYQPKELLKITENGMLPNIDPKLEIAKKKRRINIKKASEKQLMRVPGIGPKTAKKIQDKKQEIQSLSDLKSMGVPEKTIPFIELDGEKQKRITDF